MFTCLCRAVTQRRILNVIQDGACTVEEVAACTGAGTDCGACRKSIARMILDQHGAAAANTDTLSCAQVAPPVDAAA